MLRCGRLLQSHAVKWGAGPRAWVAPAMRVGGGRRWVVPGVPGAPLLAALQRQVRRCAATAAGSGAPAFTTAEEDIISKCQWQSSDPYLRLGLPPPGANGGVPQQQLKLHYRVLVRYYHPDSPHAPPGATRAFQNINEAYEALLSRVGGADRSDYDKGEEAFRSYRYRDHDRRTAQVRVLGDGVVFFMLTTLLFIYIVARHNKERLEKRYLVNLLLIFIILQVFPRLLAAAVLYAALTRYLVHMKQLEVQAGTSLVVERRTAESALLLRVHGIPREAEPHVVLQVTATNGGIGRERVPPPSEGGTQAGPLPPTEEATTLTFGAGVLEVVVPWPGTPAGATYHVRGVDQAKQLVYIDRTFTMTS